jgi:hypothetical protein
MMFSGELPAYLVKDGVECEGFVDPNLTVLCRRFLDLGFSPHTPLIVMERNGKEDVEIARIKLSDPARSPDFDVRTFGAEDAAQ